MAERSRPLARENFKGVNNLKDPARLAPEELAKGNNLDIDDTGKLSSREGRTKVLTGTGYHSLWPSGWPSGLGYALGVKDDEIVKITKSGGTFSDSTIRSGLTLDKPMSFAYVGGDIYYCNGHNSGVIRDGTDYSWGMPPPSNPVLSTATGSLYAGTYQVTLTYFDADGRESGARQGASLTLSAASGISITGIPTSPDASVTHVGIYMTGPNGSVYYRIAKVSNGTSSYTIANGKHWTIELKTLFYIEPPLGKLVAYNNGRLFIVDALDPRVLWFTLPFSYHLVDAVGGYFFFENPITFLHAQPESGLVVGSDQTYWVPSSFAKADGVGRTTLATYKPYGIYGQIVDGEDIGSGLSGKWSCWASEEGICVIGPGGSGFSNLTQSQYQPPPGTSVATLVRKFNGYHQIIAMMKIVSGSQNVYVSDEMGATVRKNAIS